MGFLGYLLSNAIIVRNHQPAFAGQTDGTSMVNSWDALFTGFGNAYYMTFVIANLFLLLVCDSPAGIAYRTTGGFPARITQKLVGRQEPVHADKQRLFTPWQE